MPQLPDLNADNRTVVIPAGIYRLAEPLVLRGKHLRVVGEGTVVFRGTVPVRREGEVFPVPANMKADGFYIGDRRYRTARYPKASDPFLPFGGYAADCTDPAKTKDWKDPKGGYLHAMHKHLWGGYSYRIEGKNPDGTLILSGGWQNNRQMGMHDEYRFVENIREEMTEPGEWMFDEDAACVRAILCPGDEQKETEAVVNPTLLVLDGCEDVTFENIVFARGARTFMETKEPLLCSDWTIARAGAVLVRNSADCSFVGCVFREIGSNGVFVDGNCRGISVSRSHFKNIGASGVCFVGSPSSVRQPMTDLGLRMTEDEIDKTPGPASEDYPKNCSVEDCLIEYTGETEKQSAGVEISMSFGVTVKNCTICHCPRAGINISEGTFGGHRIEGCDVFDTVRETGDHGSFNSWGRDRFWHLSDHGIAGKYADFDMLAPNIIARNRFRCDHGWDIDLDDGSSHYVISENLCLNGGLKLREGFDRTAVYNITVNNTLHPHVWYENSGDTVEENLVFRPYAPVWMPDRWGRSVDKNILFDPGADTSSPAKELSALSKQDARSVKQNVRFRAPEKGDFTPTDLPGFETFPSEFGVRYEPLRRLADVPEMPRIRTADPGEGENREIRFCAFGLTVKSIETDGEMSVLGSAEHRGAFVLAVDPASPAEKTGLRKGDLIVEWDGEAVKKAEDLEELIGGGEERPRVKIFRDHRYLDL